MGFCALAGNSLVKTTLRAQSPANQTFCNITVTRLSRPIKASSPSSLETFGNGRCCGTSGLELFELSATKETAIVSITCPIIDVLTCAEFQKAAVSIIAADDPPDPPDVAYAARTANVKGLN